MRRLFTFIVILSTLFVLSDRLHVPPNQAAAQKPAAVQQKDKQTAQKPAPAPAAAVPVVATASAPEPTPEPPAPKYQLGGGCEQYRELVSRYDWNVEVMLAVMEGESTFEGISCNHNAVGDKFPINGVYAPSCGLLQVRTIAAWRGTCEQLQDPEYNVDVAYKIWQGQGYNAWTQYSTGKYLRYIR